LQNLTCPGVTGVLPARTVAVSVTAVCEATVVTALPPLVTASVVVVATWVAKAGAASPNAATIRRRRILNRNALGASTMLIPRTLHIRKEPQGRVHWASHRNTACMRALSVGASYRGDGAFTLVTANECRIVSGIHPGNNNRRLDEKRVPGPLAPIGGVCGDLKYFSLKKMFQCRKWHYL
jgi:hypothetical protein